MKPEKTGIAEEDKLSVGITAVLSQTCWQSLVALWLQHTLITHWRTRLKKKAVMGLVVPLTSSVSEKELLHLECHCTSLPLALWPAPVAVRWCLGTLHLFSFTGRGGKELGLRQDVLLCCPCPLPHASLISRHCGQSGRKSASCPEWNNDLPDDTAALL